MLAVANKGVVCQPRTWAKLAQRELTPSCVARRRLALPAVGSASGLPFDEQKLRDAEARVRQGLNVLQGKAAVTLTEASTAFNQALTKAKDIRLETKNLVTGNLVVQLFLTVVSWAVVFTTTHADLIKGTSHFNLPTALLLFGVVLSGVSAFMSFTYLRKVQTQGESAMDGFKQMKSYFEHAQINFIGAAATIVALQAEVGTMFASAITGGSTKAVNSTAVAAMAQAATNTLLAHLVSIVFLFSLIKKTSNAYESIVAWSAQLRDNMPRLS